MFLYSDFYPAVFWVGRKEGRILRELKGKPRAALTTQSQDQGMRVRKGGHFRSWQLLQTDRCLSLAFCGGNYGGPWGLRGAQKPGIAPWLILAAFDKLRMHRKHLLPPRFQYKKPFLHLQTFILHFIASGQPGSRWCVLRSEQAPFQSSWSRKARFRD